MKGKTKDVAVMPSDQFLERLAVSALSLFDEELFLVGIMNSLCGPFQYSFHGYGYLDSRNPEKYQGNSDFGIRNSELRKGNQFLLLNSEFRIPKSEFPSSHPQGRL